LTVERAVLHLTFPENLVREPMVYRLGREFDLRTNILRANVDEHAAWFLMELDGEAAAIDGAVRWLESEGVRVEPIPPPA
jgi:ABC-type methionine transport system ATPase subunit